MATVNYGLNAVSTVASGGVAHILDTSTAYAAGKVVSFRDNAVEFAYFNFDGALAGPVGAVGAPGYSFLGDLDTGFYRIGADNVGLSIGGTKRCVGVRSAS
mgnify:FL=1